MGDHNSDVSDGGTMQTDCSSFHSNDDTQSSIDDIDIDKILAQFPETPNTRKSVTFDFSDQSRSEGSSSILLSGPPRSPLPPIFEPSDDCSQGTYGKQVIEIAGDGRLKRAMSDGGEKGDDVHLLGHRQSVSHRPSVLSVDISHISTHYMKIWAASLLICISLFACGLFLWPLSTAPPSLPLIQSRSFGVTVEYGVPSLHVNRTSREIRIAPQGITDEFRASRYSQSFTPLGKDSFSIEISQSIKCGEFVDENAICCVTLARPICYMKDGENVRNKTIRNDFVMDIETVQGQLLILTLHRMRDELWVWDGVKESRVEVEVAQGYDIKDAFLQNGTVFSVYKAREGCEQIICIEVDCRPVRNPQCGLVRVFAALPSNSLVLLHCDPLSDHKEGLYTQRQCTLSQVLLPSLATIARSAPFQFTKGYNEDRHIQAFADYVDKTVFHVNQARLREDARWEAVISTYRLLTIA